jgi:hypothetical protein
MQQTSKVSSLWRMRGELQTAVSCHAWKVTTYNYQTALRGEGLTSLNVPPPQCAPPTLSHYHPGEDLIGLSVSSASCTTPTFTPLQQLVILSLSSLLPTITTSPQTGYLHHRSRLPAGTLGLVILWHQFTSLHQFLWRLRQRLIPLSTTLR